MIKGDPDPTPTSIMDTSKEPDPQAPVMNSEEEQVDNEEEEECGGQETRRIQLLSIPGPVLNFTAVPPVEQGGVRFRGRKLLSV